MNLSTDRITYLWHKENKIKAKQILSLKCDIVEISKTTKQGQQQKNKTKQKKPKQTNKLLETPFSIPTHKENGRSNTTVLIYLMIEIALMTLLS